MPTVTASASFQVVSAAPAPLVSTSSVVLGVQYMTPSTALAITGVSMAGATQIYGAQAGFVSQGEAAAIAQGLSNQYGLPAFVWALQAPGYDNYAVTYVVTLGLTNPFAVQRYNNTVDWGCRLVAGYKGALTLPVRQTVLTAAQNLLGVADSRFVGYKMELVLWNAAATGYSAMLARLFSGRNEVPGTLSTTIGGYTQTETVTVQPFNKENTFPVPTYQQAQLVQALAPDQVPFTITWTDPNGQQHVYQSTLATLQQAQTTFSYFVPVLFFG